MRTAWGYDVEGTINPIITVAQFHQLTGNTFSSNPRVESAINAASQSIRNYCGWHICPMMTCTSYPVGGTVVARLPATYVSEVNGVTEDGVELTTDDYQWRRDGLLKRSPRHQWSDKWDAITVEYVAGYSVDAVPDLIEAIVSIASGVLSVSAGVISESADGVSISYATSASSIASSLTSAQKSALDQYKVVGSHAV